MGEGWALEIESFLGPVKWHRADRRVPFEAQKTMERPMGTPTESLIREPIIPEPLIPEPLIGPNL